MMEKMCAVPDCGKTLSAKTKTGVCRAHNHAAGYCRCFQCGGIEVPPEKKRSNTAAAQVRELHRYSVGIAPQVYRQIRDRAEALKTSPDRIIAKLLAIAVEVDDLDTHFPIGEK